MNNVIILVGRIARNIELRKTQNGISTCNITLAVTRNYKNNQNIYETDFLTCVCYNHNAEKVAEWCQKGDMIGIRGMLQSRTYEKDDKKVYATEILVDKVNFLATGKKENKEKVEEKKEETTDVFDKAINEFSKEADLSELSSMDLPF